MSRQTLYRLYDQGGTLLYIGITRDWEARAQTHAATQRWWAQVTETRLTTFATRAEVEAAEKAAIVTERPLYNVVHNPERQRARAAWEALPPIPTTPREVYDPNSPAAKARIRELVDSAPPLTPGQKADLAQIIRAGRSLP